MAASQTGLTSCQIGDIGYPRTVHGNTLCEVIGLCICLRVLTRPFFFLPPRRGLDLLSEGGSGVGVLALPAASCLGVTTESCGVGETEGER